MSNIFVEEVYAQWAWIECTPDLMKQWQCTLDTNSLVWIHTSYGSMDEFVADAFHWATYFIGTVTTLWIIASGLMLIMAWANESMHSKWKTWLKFSIIWLLLVIFSYSAVRLIQYLAKW